MDRVGGYESYLRLLEDARAYEDVLSALSGEADASRIRDMESRSGS